MRRGRPKKRRTVQRDPDIVQFSPRGKPGRPDEGELAIDEFEAIRLADFQGLSQKGSAKLMNISQQTFSRILKKARNTMADCLVMGKVIKIQDRSYVVKTIQRSQPQQPKISL